MPALPQGWLPDGWLPEGWLPGEAAPTTVVPFIPPARTIVLSRQWRGARARRGNSPKGSDEPARVRLDFTSEVAKRWEERDVAQGERILTGAFDAVCVTPGRTGPREPRWPVVVGDVPDGGVIWRLEAASSGSIRQLASLDWVAPGDITLSGHALGLTTTSAVVTGGQPGLRTIVIKGRFEGGEGFDQPCLLLIE